MLNFVVLTWLVMFGAVTSSSCPVQILHSRAGLLRLPQLLQLQAPEQVVLHLVALQSVHSFGSIGNRSRSLLLLLYHAEDANTDQQEHRDQQKQQPQWVEAVVSIVRVPVRRALTHPSIGQIVSVTALGDYTPRDVLELHRVVADTWDAIIVRLIRFVFLGAIRPGLIRIVHNSYQYTIDKDKIYVCMYTSVGQECWVHIFKKKV